MLSLNTLRTKFGIVLVVFLAIALLSFVLGEFKGCSQNEEPVVGKVGTGEDAKEVAYSEFSEAYNEALALFGENNANVDQAKVVDIAWEMLADKHATLPALEELGLAVTKAERDAMWNGTVSSAFLQEYFRSNPYEQSDVTPEELAKDFIEGLKSGQVSAHLFNVVDKQMVASRAKEKFINLAINGIYANSLELQKNVNAENNTYDGKYVLCDYASIADADVEVSQSEIEAYYSANLAHYKKDSSRNIGYVHFAITPSSEDKEALEAEFNEAVAQFEVAEDLNNYIAPNVLVEENVKVLNGEELEAIAAGKTYKTKRGDNWYASRAVESLVAPKDYDLQHIVLFAENSEVENIYNEAKAAGADFDALVEKYSIQNNNGNKEFGVAYSVLPTIFTDALAKAKKDDVVKIDGNGMVLITKVLNVGEKTRQYRLATLNCKLEASNKTRNDINVAAEEFAKNAAGSVENFSKALTSYPRRTAEIKKSQRSVQGLNNSLELLRWAYQAKVGEVSSVFELGEAGWVVAVVTAADSDCKPLAQVSSSIKSILVDQKKAALLKAKMQGATLDEIAANAGVEAQSFVGVKSTSEINGDSRVAVALESVTAENVGKVLPLIEGAEGVYAVVVTEVKEAAPAEAASLEGEQLKARVTEAENIYNSETWYEGKSNWEMLPGGGYRILGGEPEYRRQLDKAVEAGVNVTDNTLQYF